MRKIRVRGEAIRRFIFEQIEAHHEDIAAVTAEQFVISRQAVNKHAQRLVDQKARFAHGDTGSRRYAFRPFDTWQKTYDAITALAEDVDWRRDIEAAIAHRSENIRGIWHYGFTEMFNNVVDHAKENRVMLQFKKTAMTTEFMIIDDGIGIFVQDSARARSARRAPRRTGIGHR